MDEEFMMERAGTLRKTWFPDSPSDRQGEHTFKDGMESDGDGVDAFIRGVRAETFVPRQRRSQAGSPGSAPAVDYDYAIQTEEERLMDEKSNNAIRRVAQAYEEKRLSLKDKVEWGERWRQLQTEQAALERHRRHHIFSTKLDGLRRDAADLGSLCKEMSKKRAMEGQKLRKKLQNLSTSARKLRSKVDIVVKDGPAADVSALKALHTTFDSMEVDLDDFKNDAHGQYSELERMEKALTGDIMTMAETVEGWHVESDRPSRSSSRKYLTPNSKRSKQSSASTTRKALLSTPDSRPPELVSVEKQIVAMGGSTGGWDSRDHATFLRLLSKYKLRCPPSLRMSDLGSNTKYTRLSGPQRSLLDSMLQVMGNELAGIDRDELEAHWRLYRRYLQLQDQKKRAVSQWRKSKADRSRSAPAKVLAPSSGSSHGLPPGSIRDGESEDSEAAERCRRRAAAKRFAEAKRQEETREKIAAWKAEKEAQKVAEEQAEMKKRLTERMERQQKYEERQGQREMLALYKLQREAERARQQAVERVLATARGEPSGYAPSQEVLMRRHEKNMRKIREKLAKQEEKVEDKKKRERRLRAMAAKVEPKVRYDGTRLTRHTAASARAVITDAELNDAEEARYSRTAHNERVHSTSGAELARGRSRGFATGRASSLRVPKWRRGVGR